MYEYDNIASKESLNFASKAVASLEEVPSNMSTAASLSASVQVLGLEFLSDGSYAENIEIISNYPSIIIGMISQAERDLIIDCIQNGDNARLVQYVNEGKISTQALIEYSKEYMLDIMNSGNANTYNKSFETIGGEGSRYKTVIGALAGIGFDDEFIYNLSNEYCRNLINNDLMYTKEGTVTMATSFTGLLSIFGLKLGYGPVEFDRSYDGFYFGTGEEGSRTLGVIDCCNYTDWLARCSGIDIYAYNAPEKYKYVIDGYTPEGEILATIDDDYFKNGEGGDWLSNNGHIMMIVSNDGNGYFFAEDGQFAEINYMTYQELSNKGYKVTNTDALYRNTAKPHTNEYIWLNEDDSLASSYSNSGKVQKTEVFANPYWYINQSNINLTEAEQESLIRQYNERNQNPNFTGVEFVPVEKEPQAPLEENIPEGLDETKPITSINPDDTNTSSGSGSSGSSSGSGSSGSSSDNVIANILPDNKFSDVLPQLSNGKLGSMEISNSSVSYEVFNVSNSTYGDYVQSLLDEGYVMTDNGTFIKGNYEVVTMITKDGNMSIKLNII